MVRPSALEVARSCAQCPPESWYAREESRLAFDVVLECLRQNGPKPRYRGNRLIFLAADHGALTRLSDAARVALAWGSIVDDVKEARLNIDLLQKRQAEKELQTAEEVLPRAARECYKWLLCPVQETPTAPKPTVEAFPLNTAGGSVGGEIERVCVENELVITTWSAWCVGECAEPQAKERGLGVIQAGCHRAA